MANVKTVLIGCKLPHGITIELPLNPESKVTLNGANRARESEIIIMRASDYGRTRVDADWWAQWIAVNKDQPYVKSGAVFEAKDPASLKAIGTEYGERLTGLQPMAKKDDPRAPKSLDKTNNVVAVTDDE